MRGDKNPFILGQFDRYSEGSWEYGEASRWLSQDMEERALSGERVISASTQSRTYPRDRTCSEDGCRTHLSIYNESDYCSLHHRAVTPRTRGRKIA